MFLLEISPEKLLLFFLALLAATVFFISLIKDLRTRKFYYFSRYFFDGLYTTPVSHPSISQKQDAPTLEFRVSPELYFELHSVAGMLELNFFQLKNNSPVLLHSVFQDEEFQKNRLLPLKRDLKKQVSSYLKELHQLSSAT